MISRGPSGFEVVNCPSDAFGTARRELRSRAKILNRCYITHLCDRSDCGVRLPAALSTTVGLGCGLALPAVLRLIAEHPARLFDRKQRAVA